ncbi:MAG: hypothetical protein Q4E94_06635, partial [Clostridia bacterium]|nr:hypothetical protein [Clostridia bacterium]
MKMKKVVAALCALFVLLGGRTPNIPTAANTAAEDCTVYAASNVAEVVFDSEDPKKTGFSVVEPGANKTPQVYERGGEDCWVMDKLQGNAKATINFTLDSSMKSPSFDGSVYDIEVEYYDSGKGFCVLYYNNTEGRTEVYNEIYTEATNAWRTKTFTLANADFSKPVNGEYDFNLSIKNRHDNNSEYLSPESIGIRRVRVMRRPIKNKLYVSAKIDETGNTFEWFAKDKIINTNIRNVSGEDAEAEVIFRAVTDSGFVKAEITESVSLPKDESKDIELNIGSVDFCGFYYLEAEIKMSDGITFTQRPTMFTIVKTDPDGIKNKRLYVAEHLERYVEDEIIRQGVDMIRKGNFGGCRESLADRVVNIVLPELKKYGMEYLPIIWNFAETAKTNPWGLNSWAELPHTEKQYAAWRTSVEEQVLKVR